MLHFKAADRQTNELVGWTLVRWEDGSWLLAPDALTNGSDQLEFVGNYQREVKRNWRNLVAEKPHVGKIFVFTIAMQRDI